MSHKLTAKQIKALYLLASGQPIISIAKQLKLRRETLSRWLKIHEFIVEYERIIQEIFFDLRNQIAALMESAIKAIKSDVNSYNNVPKCIQSVPKRNQNARKRYGKVEFLVGYTSRT